MPLNRNKLYCLLLITCIAGYIWLYFNLTTNQTAKNQVGVCLIKHFTNIPCPSCGSTRSIISLSKGNFSEALQINPLGYLVASILFLTPLWVAFDIASKRKTLFLFYLKMETYLKKTKFAIPVLLFVIINWIWNIKKGL